MAAATVVPKMSSLLMGICVPSLKHNASKIKVPVLYFDSYLLMHFKKQVFLYAYDPEKICKTGDFVLVEALPKNMSSIITHKVLEVVYPCGDITDPITGKKIFSNKYRDEEDLKDSVYGNVQSKFDYKKAPPRGWQENKKDFSHRETYVKYHEFDEDDPNKDQPFSTTY